MATRVIAAQDKTTSGAGDDVQIKAGNANTSGAGGNILLVPGIQATTGGNGIVRIAPPSNGSSATLELVEPVFNYGMKLSMDDYYYATLGFTNAGSLALSIPSNMYIWNNGGISAKGATATGFGYSSSTTNLNISYLHMRETGVITFYGAAGVAYGSVGQIKVTNGSTGGGSLAYTSSTPTALSTNPTNDLVLTGSAFQRLSASSAVSLTGIAPPSTGSHVDGRLIWLYNVGSFNITLKHSQTSTAANQFVNEGGGDIVLGPNRVVQAIYDSTTTKWRINGETYPYVFPTADGTNGQVLTTNGSGTLSWTTVSAGASASGTTNYIAKFTGASTLGNSLIFDNGTNVGVGTASPGEKFHVDAGSGVCARMVSSTTAGIEYHNVNGTWKVYIGTESGGGGARYNSADSQHTFYNNSTAVMRIVSTGNVGFGTTSPDKRLTIAANGPSPGITIYKSPDGTLNSAQLVAALGTGSSNTNAGTTGGNEYGILQLNHSGTVRCQFYANAGGAAGSNFVLDGVSFGTTATSAGQVYIIPANAASKALVVRGAGSQSANLTEWQNDSGTVLASVDNLGRHIKSYNSASGLSTFSVGKTVLGAVHFTNGAGSGTSARNEAAITFQGGSVTEAQAGIYVTNDNTTGTHMALATTDNYTSGPQLGLTISNTGAISFPRASIVSTPAVCSIGSNSNDGGVLKLYSSGFGLRITSLNGDIISGDVNSVNITPGAAGNTTGLNVVANMGANGTVAGFTNNGNVGSKVVVIKGKAAQTGNLTEWQDSTGAVVASVSPTGAFFGSSYTSYGTVDSATQIFGNNYWTPNMTGGVTSPSAGTYTKSSGTTDWNAQVYSSEGYIKNVYCSAQASQTTGYIMFGLNSDPTTDAVYSSLDYAWYVQQGGVLAIWENNAQIATYGSYTTSTVLSITYDGTNVRYWKDGVLQRTVARSVGNPLYLDSSFHTLSSSLNSVQFGPIGQPFGISGTSGYLPKFTSQQTLGNSIVYDNGTNVGIGTASPSYKLHVSGQTYLNNGSSNPLYIEQTVADGNTRDAIYMYEASAQGTGRQAISWYNGNSSYYKARIYTEVGSNYGATRFYIDTADNARTVANRLCIYNGLVGINTTTPDWALSVKLPSNGTTNGIKVEDKDSTNPIAGLTFTNAYDEGSLVLYKTNVLKTYIRANGDSYFTGGNVGIGTSSPGAKLQVDTGATGTKGQIIKAFLGQTANLTEWQSSAGTVLAFIAPNGVPAAYGPGVVTSNAVFGDAALRDNTTGANNTAIGNTANVSNTTGSNNTVVGNFALGYTTTTGGNTALGAAAGRLTNGGASLTGVTNGIYIGYISTGTASASNEIVIGASAAGKGSNTTVIGNTSTTNNYFYGSTTNTMEGGTYLKMVRPSDGAEMASLGCSSGSWEAFLSSNYGALNLNCSGGGLRMGSWTTWADSTNAQVMWLKNSNVIWGNNALGVTNRTAFNTSYFQITAGSYATIPAPTSRFEVYGDSQFISQSTSAKTIIVKAAASQTANLTEWQNNGGTALAYMDSGGNFFAVSKSFLIDHPTPAKAAEGKKLRYASLEGPENGVYFRGKLEGENEIVLPDYWKDLVDPESITVNLTPRKRPQPNLFVVDANAEKVTIESDREICCDFIVYGTRKDIAKLEVEVNGN
jgi:hypothetical protein